MNEIKNFGYYLFNRWCLEESVKLFGENLGNHIWQKWHSVVREGCGDQLFWYMNLDANCQKMLSDRANELYS